MEFFASLARKYGVFLGVDEATSMKVSLDVARICIRTRCFDVFNMVVVANINESLYNIKMIEEWCGPQKWSCLHKQEVEGESVSQCEQESEYSEESEDGTPALFTAVDGGFGLQDSDGEDEMSHGFRNDDVASPKETSVVNETDPNLSLRRMQSGCVLNAGNETFDPAKRRWVDVVNNDCVDLGVFPNKYGVVECNYSIGCEEIRETEIQPSHVKLGEEVRETEKSDGKQVGFFGGVFEVGENSKKGGYKKSNGPAKCNRRKRIRKKKTRSAHNYEKGNSDPSALNEICTRNTAASCELQPSLCANGVVRNPPNAFSFSSVIHSGDGSLTNSISAGDSGIRMGNVRFEEAHENKVAGKLWRIATEDLGVTGEEVEEVYIERIKDMETRDHVGQGRKGQNNNSSK